MKILYDIFVRAIGLKSFIVGFFFFGINLVLDSFQYVFCILLDLQLVQVANHLVKGFVWRPGGNYPKIGLPHKACQVRDLDIGLIPLILISFGSSFHIFLSFDGFWNILLQPVWPVTVLANFGDFSSLPMVFFLVLSETISLEVVWSEMVWSEVVWSEVV